MSAEVAALATIILLFVLLAIVAAYGVYANWKLQKDIDATEVHCAANQSTRSKLNEKRNQDSV